ncbi:MAG: hypothetical protein M1822_005114 [Bathelium mastoideum]|nr:MAG: hypothetical protein M1822_005114 [Bathelium mastoideum]
MPPLIRRQPLIERIKAKLNPWDFLIWVSEELDDLEDLHKTWATTIGLVANFVFMIARANSGPTKSRGDDVFGDFDRRRGAGYIAWICTFIVHFLTAGSIVNAIYTFVRKRHYRLFEAPVDAPPSTPSAHRVRVDSSPLASSPLRFLSNIISSSTGTAESRAHPDPSRDVWELAVWDPTPLCLRLFCLFSPGHVLIYTFFLPCAPLDPRPSVTVATTILLTSLLSAQLSLLQSNYSQNTKDTALIQKEVMNEYDTKYVHPSINRPVRDVGTQTRATSTSPAGVRTREVDIYTPTTVINRGFKTNPNPNYTAQYDPDSHLSRPTPQPTTQSRNIFNRQPSHHRPTPRTSLGGTALGTTPGLKSPPPSSSSNLSNGYPSGSDFSSPIRPRHTSDYQPLVGHGVSSASGGGDGGSLGVYTHANSPLRKAASANQLRGERDEGSGQGPAAQARRPGSPLKRVSLPPGGVGAERRSQPGKTGSLSQRFTALRDGERR